MKKVIKFLLEWIILSMVNFALGGVFFFLLRKLGVEFYSVGDEIASDEFYYIFIGNFAEAGVALIILRLFSLYHHHHHIRKKYLRYALLILLLYIFEQFINHVLMAFHKKTLFTEGIDLVYLLKDLLYIHYMELIFDSQSIVAALVLYIYSQKEKVRTDKMTKQSYEMAILQELKTKAELEALQAKINPHFLYNSLNSVASLIHDNPDKAEQMVLLLAKFFRYSTNAKSQYYSTLSDELEMVKTYLDVEKVRFDDRLSYEILIENPQLLYSQIPQFLIQPIVENAIKHSISKISENGVIQLYIKEEDNLLAIEIRDNGVPFPENLQVGYGLRSTQEKLRLLGGDGAKMEIENGENKAIKLFINKNLKLLTQ